MTTQRSKNCKGFLVLCTCPSLSLSLSLSLCTIPNVYSIFSNTVSSETQFARLLSTCSRLARETVPNCQLDAVTIGLDCAWIVTCVLRFVSFAEFYPDWRRRQRDTTLTPLCVYNQIHCTRFCYECFTITRAKLSVRPDFVTTKQSKLRKD